MIEEAMQLYAIWEKDEVVIVEPTPDPKPEKPGIDSGITPKPNPIPEKPIIDTSNNPQTSDTITINIPIILSLFSVVMMAVLLKKKYT